MRNLRKLVGMALPILGMVLVFAAILVPALSLNLQLQIGVALVGILVIEAGVWRLTEKILPNERRFLALRAEVDGFIGLVRELNRAAMRLKKDDGPEARESFREAMAALHASVDRMGGVAGRENEIG